MYFESTVKTISYACGLLATETTGSYSLGGIGAPIDTCGDV